MENKATSMLTFWLVTIKILSTTLALDNGLALVPPMGWLTWLGFECNTDCDRHPNTCISEDLIKRTADRMVSDGYLAAGYEYVIIDDCWLEPTRGPDGRMVPHRTRFRSGIRNLADYIHSRGLKFGMYQDWGNFTCAGLPGALGHEALDVDTFVQWRVDYLKLDGCYADIELMDQGYPAFGKLLNTSGRPILYSCSWPAYQEGHVEVNYTAIADSCNIWRNWGDISRSWRSVLATMEWFGDNQDRLQRHAGRGRWNDPDMLVVGHEELTVSEARAQMAVWAILAAPLMMSVDLDSIRPEYRQILQDPDVIAIDQDPLGRQGLRTLKTDDMDVWMRELVNDRYAVAIVAKTQTARRQIRVTFRQMQIPDGRYDVQDIFKEEEARVLDGNSMLSVTFAETPGVKFYAFVPRNTETTELTEDVDCISINNEINDCVQF